MKNAAFKKIIFLFNSHEATMFLKGNRIQHSSLKESLFICMTPSALLYLKKHSIESQNTLQFFTNESHGKVLEKSDELLGWLRRNLKFVELDIGAYQSFQDLFISRIRPAILYCLWALEIIINAVERHKPEIISAFYPGKQLVLSISIEPEEKYLGFLVKTAAEIKGIKFEGISNKIHPVILLSSTTATYIKEIIGFILRYSKFILWEKLVFIKRKVNSEKPILFSTAHNMGRIIEDLNKKLIKKPFFYLKGPVVANFMIHNFIIRQFWKPYSNKITEQKELFNGLAKEITSENHFVYRNIKFSEIIAQKINDSISNFIIWQMLWAIRLSKLISKLGPDVIISSATRFDDMIIGELSSNRKIAGILISHGSHVYPKNKYEKIEWGEHGFAFLRSRFPLLALQSPLAEDYLNIFPSTSKKFKTSPLVWGSPLKLGRNKLILEKIFKGRYNFQNLKIILHAGTPKSSNALRLYVYETIDEYIQAICDLANAIEKIPNTVLIVKFRPRKEININDIHGLVPFSKKVILSIEESLTDILGISDLLVSFSSTTIEEALQNKIPVLLYGGAGRYQHVLASEIRRDYPVETSAVYYTKKASDLEYAISSILKLNIDRDKEGYLFNPYIYRENEKLSIVDAIKNYYCK